MLGFDDGHAGFVDGHAVLGFDASLGWAPTGVYWGRGGQVANGIDVWDVHLHLACVLRCVSAQLEHSH